MASVLCIRDKRYSNAGSMWHVFWTEVTTTNSTLMAIGQLLENAIIFSPVNTRHWSNDGLMLDQRPGRWPSIRPILGSPENKSIPPELHMHLGRNRLVFRAKIIGWTWCFCWVVIRHGTPVIKTPINHWEWQVVKGTTMYLIITISIITKIQALWLFHQPSLLQLGYEDFYINTLEKWHSATISHAF